jgi:hypothetical protein
MFRKDNRCLIQKRKQTQPTAAWHAPPHLSCSRPPFGFAIHRTTFVFHYYQGAHPTSDPRLVCSVFTTVQPLRYSVVVDW